MNGVEVTVCVTCWPETVTTRVLTTGVGVRECMVVAGVVEVEDGSVELATVLEYSSGVDDELGDGVGVCGEDRSQHQYSSTDETARRQGHKGMVCTVAPA